MNTVGTPLLWGGFAVVVAIMLAIDLLLQGRRGSHSMTMKQAAGCQSSGSRFLCCSTPPSGGIWCKPRAGPSPIRRP